jgi:HSP20 family protein
MFDDAFRLEQFTEDDGTFVLRAELPGVDPDDGLEVTVDDGRLVIAAEREERSEDRNKGQYRSEFRYGSFHRSIRLPSGADEDAIDATFTQGILEIRVPRADDASPVRTIPVASKE